MSRRDGRGKVERHTVRTASVCTLLQKGCVSSSLCICWQLPHSSKALALSHRHTQHLEDDVNAPAMAPAMKRVELLPSLMRPLKALLYTSKEKKFSACGKQASKQQQQQHSDISHVSRK